MTSRYVARRKTFTVPIFEPALARTHTGALDANYSDDEAVDRFAGAVDQVNARPLRYCPPSRFLFWTQDGGYQPGLGLVPFLAFLCLAFFTALAFCADLPPRVPTVPSPASQVGRSPRFIWAKASITEAYGGANVTCYSTKDL
jgi:hypothetical protein